MKTCLWCRTPKPLDQFNRRYGRIAAACNACVTTPHTCRGCGKTRTLAGFRFYGERIASRCNECRRNAAKAADEKAPHKAPMRERRCLRCDEMFETRVDRTCYRCRATNSDLSWQCDV